MDVDDDFLTRERAALGDDAAQFAKVDDNTAVFNTYDDGDNDLLGGGDSYGVNGAKEFESSFPAIDTRNDVGILWEETSIY